MLLSRVLRGFLFLVRAGGYEHDRQHDKRRADKTTTSAGEEITQDIKRRIHALYASDLYADALQPLLIPRNAAVVVLPCLRAGSRERDVDIYAGSA